jgi:hypothetical protein
MAESKSRSSAGARKRRTPRAATANREHDLETTIEEEMFASGRTSVIPRAGVVGARPSAVSPITEDPDDAVGPPRGDGSDVAPTAQALRRERLRHQLQRPMGVQPAGPDGQLNQRRAGVERRALDQAAALADREVAASGDGEQAGGDGTEPGAEGAATSGRRTASMSRWLRNHPGSTLVGTASAALLVGVAMGSFRRA